MTTSILIWALIIVTNANAVNVSTGYTTEGLCKDAISIAKYGLTVMEKKSADEAYRVQQTRLKQEFEAAHPPHPTTDKDRATCAIVDNGDGSGGSAGAMTVYGDVQIDYSCTINKNTGMTTYQWSTPGSFGGGGGGTGGGYTVGSSNHDYENNIKFAKCVAVNPEDK